MGGVVVSVANALDYYIKQALFLETDCLVSALRDNKGLAGLGLAYTRLHLTCVRTWK